MIATHTTSTPALQLLRMTDGLVVHQALCAAARLGVADLLADTERHVAEVAAALHVDQGALYRTLRFLAGHGVFRQTAQSTFANTPLSQYMRSDVPGSVRSVLIFRGGRFYFSPFVEFLSAVETGQPSRARVLGEGGFQYLRRHPEEERVFDEAMTAISGLWAQTVAAAYDFGRWETLMDLGGGNGLLLATILRAHAGLRGVLADEPTVIARAQSGGVLAGDLAARARCEACDFFEAVPTGSRAVLMKNVLHDWDDGQARRILLNCRRAVPDDGALLLVEYCVGEENVPSLGKTIDLVMLTVTGGKERTIDEHQRLLGTAGFTLERTVRVAPDIMLLEALPASVC
ncbi:MAG: methyltransferase [Thermoanaerobaculia bacterium]